VPRTSSAPADGWSSTSNTSLASIQSTLRVVRPHGRRRAHRPRRSCLQNRAIRRRSAAVHVTPPGLPGASGVKCRLSSRTARTNQPSRDEHAAVPCKSSINITWLERPDDRPNTRAAVPVAAVAASTPNRSPADRTTSSPLPHCRHRAYPSPDGHESRAAGGDLAACTRHDAGVEDTVRVRCPYCREWVDLYVDPDTTGVLVEDCAVCCRPWTVMVERDANRLRVHVSRAQ